MSDSNEQSHSARIERAMALFESHQKRLYNYIHSLVPRPADADEILQETSIVIWKKLEQFQEGTDFLAWSYRIAYFQTLDYRKRKARQWLTFSDEVLEQVAEVIEESEPYLEKRREALSQCRQKLNENDQELLKRCYSPDTRVEDVSKEMGRQATSVYRSLRRIRQLLADCIEKQMMSQNA